MKPVVAGSVAAPGIIGILKGAATAIGGVLAGAAGAIIGTVVVVAGSIVIGKEIIDAIKEKESAKEENNKGDSGAEQKDKADGKTESPKYPGNDGEKSPGENWEWRGNGDPGSGQGSWYNPNTGETLHPDVKHPEPIGPHWDYKAPDGTWYRLNPDGSLVPK